VKRALVAAGLAAGTAVSPGAAESLDRASALALHDALVLADRQLAEDIDPARIGQVPAVIGALRQAREAYEKAAKSSEFEACRAAARGLEDAFPPPPPGGEPQFVPGALPNAETARDRCEAALGLERSERRFAKLVADIFSIFGEPER
jgi:hypothetical protein